MQAIISSLIWLYWTICFTTALIVISTLYVVTYPFDRYHEVPNRVLKGLAFSLMIPMPGWRLKTRGADPSKVEKPTIVVANHQSFLDMPLLYLLPWSMKWVAKKSMFKIPILGWIMSMTGHLPIDRKSRGSIRKLDELVAPIRQGIPGMIFPEGTRTLSGELRPFKNGAFKLAEQYNFQVLPVVLNGGFEAMQPGSWKFNLKQKFTVSVLEPLEPGNFNSAEDLKNETYRQIYEELQLIRSHHD